MTDQEITEIIALKVMEWKPTDEKCKCSSFALQYNKGCECGAWQGFGPLYRDSDCMMAWDKFSETQPTELHRSPNEWSARLRRGQAEWTNSPDRRRAMCECMAKAVSSD